MAGTVTKFENLPANAQALILAKLAMELRSQHTASIDRLARMRRTDVMSLWRSICRKAKQPVCSIPLDAIGSD